MDLATAVVDDVRDASIMDVVVVVAAAGGDGDDSAFAVDGEEDKKIADNDYIDRRHFYRNRMNVISDRNDNWIVDEY